MQVDWIGLRACVRRGLSPANTIRPSSTGIVCGAGGQARSAVYAMLSMGVRNIFVCNRTIATAHALADHYNRLIDEDIIKDARESDGTPARVRVIEKFTDQWPQEFSYPTMVVCTIPAQKQDGTAPTSFRVPDSWLRSPTGGVAVEVGIHSFLQIGRILLTILHSSLTTPWSRHSCYKCVLKPNEAGF